MRVPDCMIVCNLPEKRPRELPQQEDSAVRDMQGVLYGGRGIRPHLGIGRTEQRAPLLKKALGTWELLPLESFISPLLPGLRQAFCLPGQCQPGCPGHHGTAFPSSGLSPATPKPGSASKRVGKGEPLRWLGGQQHGESFLCLLPALLTPVVCLSFLFSLLLSPSAMASAHHQHHPRE